MADFRDAFNARSPPRRGGIHYAIGILASRLSFLNTLLGSFSSTGNFRCTSLMMDRRLAMPPAADAAFAAPYLSNTAQSSRCSPTQPHRKH